MAEQDGSSVPSLVRGDEDYRRPSRRAVSSTFSTSLDDIVVPPSPPSEWITGMVCGLAFLVAIGVGGASTPSFCESVNVLSR